MGFQDFRLFGNLKPRGRKLFAFLVQSPKPRGQKLFRGSEKEA